MMTYSLDEVKYSNSMAATIECSLEWDDEEFQPDEPHKRKGRTSLDRTTQQESEFGEPG